MKPLRILSFVFFGNFVAFVFPAVAQVELTGAWNVMMYEDYIERGPGEFLGNFTGMPKSCDQYCCGWIERQGLPGAAPGLTCNDGNLGELRPGSKKEK